VNTGFGSVLSTMPSPSKSHAHEVTPDGADEVDVSLNCTVNGEGPDRVPNALNAEKRPTAGV